MEGTLLFTALSRIDKMNDEFVSASESSAKKSYGIRRGGITMPAVVCEIRPQVADLCRWGRTLRERQGDGNRHAVHDTTPRSGSKG